MPRPRAAEWRLAAGSSGATVRSDNGVEARMCAVCHGAGVVIEEYNHRRLEVCRAWAAPCLAPLARGCWRGLASSQMGS
jgi:hypothetical protein